MNWWVIAALVMFDLYVVCFVVLGWAIKTAPLVPSSHDFLSSAEGPRA